MNAKNNSGQSMVEFALILPILLLLIMGIIEFSFIFTNYLAMSNASREAARSISLGSTDTVAEQRIYDVASILEKSRLSIDIDPIGGNRTQGDMVTVSLEYDYNFLTPIINGLLGEAFKLQTSATMRVE